MLVLSQKNFLTGNELSSGELRALLNVALQLKQQRSNHEKPLLGKHLAPIIRKTFIANKI